MSERGERVIVAVRSVRWCITADLNTLVNARVRR